MSICREDIPALANVCSLQTCHQIISLSVMGGPLRGRGGRVSLGKGVGGKVGEGGDVSRQGAPRGRRRGLTPPSHAGKGGADRNDTTKDTSRTHFVSISGSCPAEKQKPQSLYPFQGLG